MICHFIITQTLATSWICSFTFSLQHPTHQYLPHWHKITFPLWLVCTRIASIIFKLHAEVKVQSLVHTSNWFEVVGELYTYFFGCREHIRAIAKAHCVQELFMGVWVTLGACSPSPTSLEITPEAVFEPQIHVYLSILQLYLQFLGSQIPDWLYILAPITDLNYHTQGPSGHAEVLVITNS